MKVKDAQFFTVVSSFLNVYLVKNRSCSSNTVKSYEDALNLLFTFLEGTKDIPRQRVSWSHFTRQNIQEFVDWLEKVRNCAQDCAQSEWSCSAGTGCALRCSRPLR